MKTAGYIGSFLPDGHLTVAPDVVRELGLRPNDPVQVVLIPLREEADAESLAEERAEIWRQVDALSAGLSGREFSLTDAILQTRKEEDAAL